MKNSAVNQKRANKFQNTINNKKIEYKIALKKSLIIVTKYRVK